MTYVSVSEIFPGSTVREFVTSATPHWGANNPSIAFSPEEGYRAIVRSSNFSLDESGCVHISYDPEQVIRTQNFLAVLDDELRVTDMERIDTSAVDGPVNYHWVRGAEDARLHWFAPERCWRYSASHRQHRNDGVVAIAVDTLDGVKVTNRRILPTTGEGVFQKNFLPTGRLDPEFITLCNPGTVWRDEQFVVSDRVMPPETAEFRGSSQALKTPDGYIAVTHEVTWPGRCYWHRICSLDHLGYLTNYTEPFYFKEPGVEFANGMTEWNDHYVISFGFREVRALLAFVPKQRVLDRLS